MRKFNIKRIAGRETLIFLFFLLVSCCLWLMLTLNQDYETEIEVAVNIKDVPQNVGFSSAGDDAVRVRVRVRDRGTTLINYTFASFLPVTINYHELVNRKGRLSLPISLLRRHIEGQLQSSTAVISMQPDTFIYYTRESALRLPVRFSGKYSVARQYVAGAPKVFPDSVWVYAPKNISDTLTHIPVSLIESEELRDSLIATVPLALQEGVQCSPSEVRVVVPISPFAEKGFEVPIIGVGFPDNLRLRTFPSHVKVVMNVNMSVYEQISANDFEVGVDYSEVQGTASPRVRLRILSMPKNVRDVRVVPSEVEYLIEQL